MTLNFSRRPFASRLSEENIGSPMRIANGCLVEGISERSGDIFSQPWCSNIEKGDCFDYGKHTGDRCGTQDSASVDILDILPSDPFGMNISNTVTAITGWLEDLEVDCTQYGRDNIWVGDRNHQLFAGLSFIWNNAMRFQELPEKSGKTGSESCHGFEKASDPGTGNMFCHGTLISSSSVNTRNGRVWDRSDLCTNKEEATLHPGFGFVLYHLGLKDLISVGMVCKPLRTLVLGDSLLWKHIHIVQPLNEKIIDEDLLQLTKRAQDTLYCLRLIECTKITDDGLRRVLECHPQIVKLSVSGCTRITIDGVVKILKDLKSEGKLRVKHLGIGGLFGVTKDHFDELFELLDIDICVEQTVEKPRYYHKGDLCMSCDDDRALDIELCPICQNTRIVFDCPAEDCKGKKQGSDECRACSICIPRCAQCGRCINDGEYEETFCLEFLCCSCLKQIKLSTPS